MTMQLLQKNTRHLLIWLPVVLLLCSGIFFVMLKMHASHMQEKQLLLKQTNIWNAFAAKNGNIEKHIQGEYDIAEATLAASLLHESPGDTLLYYEDRKAYLPFSMLTSKLQWNHKDFLVTTYTSSKEVSHLIVKVFLTEALILLVLLVTIVVMNRKSSGALWKPFFTTMKKITDFDITKNQPVQLPAETGITEFNELNKAITAMVGNANKAYHLQKQFVENASHEMQTPLAIIRSKLELLMNQPQLTERTAVLLADISAANNRLSQMNRTLLLLAKIENKQFPETTSFDLSELLTGLIEEFKAHYDNFPESSFQLTAGVIIHANRSLIEMLIANLLKNAIDHNLVNGKLKITLNQSALLIENTGPPPGINPEELFERFKKGSHESKTTGLGLALVKQICHLYGFKPLYTFHNGWHRVSISFAEQAS